MVFYILLFIYLSLSAIYLYLTLYVYNYWKRKNVPQVEAISLFGSLSSPINQKIHSGVLLGNLYATYKAQGHKYFGMYLLGRPIFVPLDLNCIKNILCKNFDHFTDRGIYYNERDDPLSTHIITLGGARWKNLRTKLNAAFTTAKLQTMFQKVIDCAQEFEGKLAVLAETSQAVDAKEIFDGFTCDVTGSCIFGLELNSIKNSDSPFRLYAMKFLERNRWFKMKNAFMQSFPGLSRLLRLKLTQEDVSHFFFQVVRDTVKQRGCIRKDFLQLLLDAYNEGHSGYHRDGNYSNLNEIVAQCLAFFIAGYETSATTMTFAVFELATHPKIQEKLREEIGDVLGRYDGEISYESIQEMKYMDQVVEETLRKYPPLSKITRVCVKDYTIPETNVIIERGTRVIVPIYGIHHDEVNYPDPGVFNPGRFSDQERSKRHQFSHIPFGGGPRICIGMRFGLIQVKVGLTALLKNYMVVLDKKTEVPLRMSPKTFVLAAEGGIWINIHRLET